MKTFLATLLFASCLFLMAFASSRSNTIEIGTYGTEHVNLSLNEDNSFVYEHDHHELSVQGTWERKGSHIILNTSEDVQHLPLKWKMDAKDPCLRSRDKAEFIRLCLCE